jgi:hypothetical protein
MGERVAHAGRGGAAPTRMDLVRSLRKGHELTAGLSLHTNHAVTTGSATTYMTCTFNKANF